MKNIDFIRLLRKKINIISANLKFDINIIKSNKVIIFIFSLTFLYLCYLSIPSLYNEEIIKKKLKNELVKIFNSDFVDFDNYNYTFFPQPHFKVNNVTVFEKNKESSMAKIKKINFNISQKNFFNKNDFNLTLIKLNKANFNINKNNINNYKKFFSNIVEKKIKVTKSMFFLNDDNSTFAIVTINRLIAFFEDKKNYNSIFLDGNVFNLPFKLNYNVNFYKKENFLKINFGKIKLLFENISNTSEYYDSTNQIKFLNTKIVNKINNKENKNIFKIKSENSKINQSNIKYNGTVNLKPFFLNFDFNLHDVNLNKLVFINSFFENLIADLLLDNNYLNGNISFTLENIKKNKLINSGKIDLKIQRGQFDFSKSKFFIKDIGIMEVISNRIFIDENKIILKFYFDFFIKDQNKLYKKFLISKKNRINLNKISYSIEISPSNKEFIISDFEINDKDDKSIYESTFIISSPQDLRKSINELLINYDG